MSGATVAEFISYWEDEGLAYVRRGDYDWMASLVPGKRVLDVGCGIGFATQALARRGLQVFAIDVLPECLEATRARVSGEAVQFLQADVAALDEAQLLAIASFAPDTMVCWLMGAPADVTGASAGDGGMAVAAYREKTHRAVAELAVRLPSVNALHVVDRTAIPWQAKDIGRDTLVRYHNDKTLAGLPFSGQRQHALYRKLGDNVVELARGRPQHPALKSVVPTLASLLAYRKA